MDVNYIWLRERELEQRDLKALKSGQKIILD